MDSDYGIIVGQTVTAGDVNDSVPFLGLIEHIHENVVPIRLPRGRRLRFPLAHRALGELGIGFFVRPQKAAARVSVQLRGTIFAATRTVMCTSVPLEKICV